MRKNPQRISRHLRRWIAVPLLIAGALFSCAGAPQEAEAPVAGAPRLILFLVVDQARADPIPAFDGEPPPRRRPMGVALYKRPADGALFAVVSRKEGPTGAYLWQYRLEDGGGSQVRATKVRAFGAWSGHGEIGRVAGARRPQHLRGRRAAGRRRGVREDPRRAHRDRPGADFLTKSLALCRHPYGEGPYFCLPYVGNAQMFFYNEEIFREHGLDSAPATWDEAYRVMKEITEAGEGRGLRLSHLGELGGADEDLARHLALGVLPAPVVPATLERLGARRRHPVNSRPGRPLSVKCVTVRRGSKVFSSFGHLRKRRARERPWRALLCQMETR